MNGTDASSLLRIRNTFSATMKICTLSCPSAGFMPLKLFCLDDPYMSILEYRGLRLA